jgi:hypothetical protein
MAAIEFGACSWNRGLARRHCDDAKSGIRDRQIEQPGDAVLPSTTRSRIALLLAAGLATAAGGCSNSGVLDDIKQGNYFTQPAFKAPDWAKFGRGNTQNATLGPKGPVAPEDLVDAAGQCAAEVPVAAPAAHEPVAAQAEPQPAQADPGSAPAQAAVGSVAGDLASTPMPQGPPPAPPPPKRVASAGPAGGLGGLQPEGAPGGSGLPFVGAIALGMTECEAVRRAGHPGQVSIGTAEGGERKVVLTYLSGPWPGIYTFQSGRLKVIDAAPVQPAPAKSNKKKKSPRTPAHTAASVR